MVLDNWSVAPLHPSLSTSLQLWQVPLHPSHVTGALTNQLWQSQLLSGGFSLTPMRLTSRQQLELLCSEHLQRHSSFSPTQRLTSPFALFVPGVDLVTFPHFYPLNGGWYIYFFISLHMLLVVPGGLVALGCFSAWLVTCPLSSLYLLTFNS